MFARTSLALLALSSPVLVLLPAGCPDTSSLENKQGDAPQSPFRVDALTPNRGPAAGGTRVTIRGGPFQDKVGVLFGAHAAVDPIIVNSRMITAFAPAQEPGVVDVIVLSNGGQVTLLGAYTYEEAPPPPPIDIVGVFPAQGPVAGGTEVTITGENFPEGTVVKFGDGIASGVSVLTSQLIVATTPAGLAGPVDVTVLTGSMDDTLAGGFNYVAIIPQIASIEPAFGPLEGGTRITLRGQNLPSNAGVLFGDSAGVDVTVINDELVTVTSPPGAIVGLVDVTLSYGGGELVIADGFEYTVDGPIFDDGTDTDGDDLTDVQEQTGWETWIEAFGLQLGVDTFGNVTRYPVTSDPLVADTDNDGLSDKTELLIKSDPRKFDSDDDGLWDGEEWNQWLTSPTGVDNDADARGRRDLQNAPNQALFDGAELFDLAVLRLPPGHPLRVVRPRATSPTLADTDGDGVSDFDEFDSTVRNGFLADLPRLEYELVGDIDVRLNIEYAESTGQSTQYGTTLAESESETIGSSYSNTLGWSVEVAVGVEHTFGLFSSTTAHAEVTSGVSGEKTWTTSRESTTSSTHEYSRLQSDSKELTETAADGAIRTAILLRNPGNSTFTVDGLSVLVSQREKLKTPGDTSPQMPEKTISTMRPSFDTLTLAPGEVAGPFELAAADVNATSIKELLARPDSLSLGTAAMNFHDQTGLDFDFVRQFTVAQTANIVIDFGDGEIRNYNVATNVDRNPDSTYRGITLRRVFEEMLRLPFGNPTAGYTTMASPIDGVQVLDSLLGRRYAVRTGGQDNWTVVTNNPAHQGIDLNNFVLKAGDRLHIFFQKDSDNDGLTDTIENAAGTNQTPVAASDADGDGLTDHEEVIDGWIAFENPANPGAPHPDGFEKRRVFSDPRSTDADEDGLPDAQERANRSDPADPDTDGDGLLDGQDPFPIRRAGIRFVKADATAGGNGRTWQTAYTTIQAAIADATAGAATPAIPDDDVAQVWVARGTYRPTDQNTPIEMRNNLRIYGGFSGPSEDFAGETKRGQRLKDPAANGCVISGDLAGNDLGPASARDGQAGGPATRSDNARTLVRTQVNADASATLDGFMLTASAATSALLVDRASPTIENCLFLRNGAASGGGLTVTGSNSQPIFRNCVFAANAASNGGGAFVGNSRPKFEDCSFEQNDAQLSPGEDADTTNVNGAGMAVRNGRVDLIRCSFIGNRAHNWGGGLFAEDTGSNGAYARVDSCRFFNNLITRGSAGGDYRGSGGAIFLKADAAVFNSVFWGNSSENHGGGIQAFRRLAVNNCTFAANRCMGTNDGGGITAGDHFGLIANVTVENTILWKNWQGRGDLPTDFDYDEVHQLSRRDGATMVVRNSCFNEPGTFAGNNNIGTDPNFRGLDTGDLSLDSDSPCIDRGNAFVDVEPLIAGLQRLPDLDFFGNPRVSDGNGDGFVTVDIGAAEARQQ